jgi:hypothetical protein
VQVASVLYYRNGGYSVVRPHGKEHYGKPVVGRPYNIVEIHLGRHRSVFSMELPSAGGAAFFRTEVDVLWEVIDPHLAANARVENVADLIEPELKQRLRDVSLRFRITEAARAYAAIQDHIASGTWEPLGADIGLNTRVYVRIDLSQKAIEQSNQLEDERFGQDLAVEQHRRKSSEEELEAQRIARRADFFRRLVAAGEHAQVAYLMAQNPDDARGVLQMLKEDQRADRREAFDFFAHMMNTGLIERWQLGDQARAVIDFVQSSSGRLLDLPSGPPALESPRPAGSGGDAAGPGGRSRRPGGDGRPAGRRRSDTDGQDLPWLQDKHESAFGGETRNGVPGRQPAGTDADEVPADEWVDAEEVATDEWGDDGHQATTTSPDGHQRWSSGHDWDHQS